MIVVGLTGNFATGKSATAECFRKKGAVVFDADQAAREAVKKGKSAHLAIVKIFGKEYLLKNG